MMVRREVTGVKKPQYTTVVRGELEEFLINNKELLKEEFYWREEAMGMVKWRDVTEFYEPQLTVSRTGRVVVISTPLCHWD